MPVLSEPTGDEQLLLSMSLAVGNRLIRNLLSLFLPLLSTHLVCCAQRFKKISCVHLVPHNQRTCSHEAVIGRSHVGSRAISVPKNTSGGVVCVFTVHSLGCQRLFFFVISESLWGSTGLWPEEQSVGV